MRLNTLNFSLQENHPETKKMPLSRKLHELQTWYRRRRFFDAF